MTRQKMAGAAKDATINIRTTASLRNQVDEAAERHGLSVAQEVELRLRASFGDVWAQRVLALDEMEPTPPRLVRNA